MNGMRQRLRPVGQCKPFLRWAGSKRQLVRRLLPYCKQLQGQYIEPFAGSACLFFQSAPKHAILADINPELIATYKAIKKDAGSVARRLSEYKKGRAHYYKIRALDPCGLLPPDRAARFIFLNRFCFNGLYRTNLNGIFNVPFGGAKVGNLPTVQELQCARTLLKRARILCTDFNETLTYARPGDFVYMDPPYATRSKRVFREYDASTFSHESLNNLRWWMDKLNRESISFVVSYADCPEVQVLSAGYQAEVVHVRRNIAGFVNDRRNSRELLITNCVIVN